MLYSSGAAATGAMCPEAHAQRQGRHPRESMRNLTKSVVPHSQKLEKSPGISKHPAQQNTNKIYKAIFKSHTKYIITLWIISFYKELYEDA